MQRTLKFLHTVAAIGLAGSLAALLAMLATLPDPTDAHAYAAVRASMNTITTWVFMPSLLLVLISGLFSIAFVRAYQNAGWAFVKLASGIILFEGGLVAVSGPMRREAERSAAAVASAEPLTAAGATMASETGSILVILAVAIANVVLGIWRPRLFARRRSAEAE